MSSREQVVLSSATPLLIFLIAAAFLSKAPTVFRLHYRLAAIIHCVALLLGGSLIGGVALFALVVGESILGAVIYLGVVAALLGIFICWSILTLVNSIAALRGVVPLYRFGTR
ncbi:MAG: hypothetical protein V3V01_18035 [Acidimicrobiales bacterium]